jgi:hypothetical protein
MRAMSLTGRLIIGFERVTSGESFRAINPVDGARLPVDFSVAGCRIR